MSKGSSKNMAGLIDYDEAIDACSWPVAKRYFLAYDNRTYDDRIYPDPEAWWACTSDKPLADPDLFLSFARLGGRGDYLSENAINAILRWVRKHGLLRLADSTEYKADRLVNGSLNQAPIGLSEFWEEARRAHEALTLLRAIRDKDYDSLRPRITRRRIDPPGRPGEGQNAEVYLDGHWIPVIERANGELSVSDVLSAAEWGLQHLVKARLTDVNLDFDSSSVTSRVNGVYRPRLVFSIPDLYTALWYQFALLMADTRAVKFCEVCKNPILNPRADQMVCGKTSRCRQEKSRRKKAREAAEGSG